ncbi:MAG TPA: hypothetical protein PKZ42_14260 [Syntrophales bacterium]|nr:hypothetical protein [Syntrophales bacterium]
MINLSSYRHETKDSFRSPKAAAIFLLFCLLIAAILVPAHFAFCDDDDDLLLCIPAIIAGSAGWRNTTLSHPIPLTYNGYDEELRQCCIVKVEDGYWIAYAKYSSVDERYFFILKTNLEGRTMIPPFLLTKLTRTDESASNYRFALIPREEGGVQVLTTENGFGSTGPATLYDYVFDRHGKMTRCMPVMKERSSSSQEFKSLWAARTADDRTVFAAFSDGAIWAGVYTDSGEALSWEAVPKTSSMDYFAAHYDAALDRLYIMYSNYYTATNSSYMTRWTLNGTREILNDLSGQVGEIYGLKSYHLMPTLQGLMVSLPNYVDNYRFFLMNQDCTIKKQVEVNGLVVNVQADNPAHMVTLDSRNVVRLVWRGPGTHPVLYYAAFTLDGRLLVQPMEINQAGSDIAMHPNVFVDGRRTTFFYSVDYAPDAGYRRLFCRHTAFDFTAGQPDLVASVPHITQSPEYATLGAGVAFRVKIFNRGEAASTAATVTLAHNGVNYVATVGVLEPGQSQLLETEFLDIPTPAYLTAMPYVTLDLANGYWTGNNHVETLVRYPGRTPIYPAGSEEYTWTVREMYTNTPLQWAQVITTLPNIQTADGAVKDVVILYESDEDGHVTTRLPSGTYTFQVSRRGYPPESPSRTVPSPSSPYFELEPPGTVTLSFEDGKDSIPLHPTPNRVRVDMEEDGGSYQYYAMGDENGLVLQEVMRGDYTYSVHAFGYQETTGSFNVAGGHDNPYKIILTPTERGSVSGDTNPGTVNVCLEGTVIGDISDGVGAFTLDDIPYGTYRVVCSKEGYAPVADQITIDSPTHDLGTFNLPAITEADESLGDWTTSAWNRIDEVPDTYWTDGYKITTAFGVFDFSGSIFYSTDGTSADFNSILLNLSGHNWYYCSVSTDLFSLEDAFIFGLDGLVDGAGMLAGFIMDQSDAESIFNSILDPLIVYKIEVSGGSTIVRVDSVCLYDGAMETVLYDSHNTWRQDYSFNGPMGYALGVHTNNIHEVKLRIYLKVMNQDFCIGPLYLMDKFMMEWRYDDDNFELKEVIQNPPNYPSFSN